nr:MAG TPA: hypothetical protein [Bacteriophage sp.]
MKCLKLPSLAKPFFVKFILASFVVSTTILVF